MNLQIVSEIVALLNEILPPHLYASDFTKEMYFTLLRKLSLYDKEEFFNDKKGAIKKALTEYFAQHHQKVSVEITFRTCTLKKDLLDASRSESFDRMIYNNMLALLDVSKQKEDFLVLPFLLSIPESIYQVIFKKFSSLGETAIVARRITRQQVNSVFELDERDIVFFLRGKITIRLFTPPKKFPPGVDKRFAGETMEAMIDLYQTYFPEGAWEYIESLLDDVITEKLNFEIIDNLTYHKQFIPVFRSMIEILLLDVVNEEDRMKIEGLTGYVLRQYFHPILLYAAKRLLDSIEKRDKNAADFIKYYTDDIVIDENGNKIQKYAITDIKQQKWNFSSILSVMMQYKQARFKLNAQQELIVTSEERVNESKIEIESEEKNYNALTEEIIRIKTLMIENDTKILEIKAKSTSQDSNSFSLGNDIKRINNLQDDLNERIKNRRNQLEISKGRLVNKKVELARKQKKVLYETKTLQAIKEQTDPIFQSYEMIAEALSLVLAKR